MYVAVKYFTKGVKGYEGEVDDAVREVYDVTDDLFVEDCRAIATRVICGKFNKLMYQLVNKFRERWIQSRCECVFVCFAGSNFRLLEELNICCLKMIVY